MERRELACYPECRAKTRRLSLRAVVITATVSSRQPAILRRRFSVKSRWAEFSTPFVIDSRIPRLSKHFPRRDKIPMNLRRLILASWLLSSPTLFAQAAESKGEAAAKPRTELLAVATPADKIRVPEGFRVELVYSVPKSKEGSWVNICHDPQGRLIVSDQGGGLYRVTPPSADSKQKLKVESIPAKIGRRTGFAVGLRQPVRDGQRRRSQQERPVPRARYRQRRSTRFRGILAKRGWRRRARPACGFALARW